MNSSYKITLLVTIVLCGLVLGYYITQDDQNQPPKVTDNAANVPDATDTSSNLQDTPRSTLRDATAANTTPASAANNNNNNNNTTPPPAANTSSTSTSSTGSLLDRVNARAQGSNDPIAPLPAAAIPSAANSNYNTSTTPVTSDARSITPNNVNPAPSARSTANNNTNIQQPRNTPRIPDTGRAALRTPQPTTGRTYTIKSGDTLSSIAEKTLGSTARWNDIAEANPYLDPRKLKPGQTIRLPDPSNVASNSDSSAGNSNNSSTPAGPLEYVVRQGDTLSRIARVHYSDPNLWDVIYRANKAVIGKDPAGIRAGMKLFIPPEPSAAH